MDAHVDGVVVPLLIESFILSSAKRDGCEPRRVDLSIQLVTDARTLIVNALSKTDPVDQDAIFAWISRAFEYTVTQLDGDADRVHDAVLPFVRSALLLCRGAMDADVSAHILKIIDNRVKYPEALELVVKAVCMAMTHSEVPIGDTHGGKRAKWVDPLAGDFPMIAIGAEHASPKSCADLLELIASTAVRARIAFFYSTRMQLRSIAVCNADGVENVADAVAWAEIARRVVNDGYKVNLYGTDSSAWLHMAFANAAESGQAVYDEVREVIGRMVHSGTAAPMVMAAHVARVMPMADFCPKTGDDARQVIRAGVKLDAIQTIIGVLGEDIATTWATQTIAALFFEQRRVLRTIPKPKRGKSSYTAFSARWGL